MSSNGESTYSSQTPFEQVRVAFVVPESELILVRPEYNSGLFIGERVESLSLERTAHRIMKRELGHSALAFSSLYALPPYDELTYGHVVRPSNARFDHEAYQLQAVSLKDYQPTDPVDEYFFKQYQARANLAS